MLGTPATDLEASLLQRWFPVPSPGNPTATPTTRFSETDLREISDVLQRVGRGTWSRIPRIYAVLRLLDQLDVIDSFLTRSISDIYFPFTHQTLPQSLNPSVANEFLQVQRVVLSSALDLERESGRHRHFSSTNDVPFIKVEDLGKGAYGYVDRVISTISYKEYARKLIPRGRTFQRDKKILQDFERELGTLKKLSHHRHIVQLIGSYTDPRFVGIVMSPVAECDLKEFLDNCALDDRSSSKSFIRSFFGCLTSALSYLHDNTIRHKDMKPQNVLVSQHTVFLTDFGISLDWSEVGQSTTTGPTPRTARYCAPEVSDYAPRNTSSDMWSLGCIFLEIWTVLKGETVAGLYNFLENNGTSSSCYHLNGDGVARWIEQLEARQALGDNPPQDWIRHLIIPHQRQRWTARQLLSEIETVNIDPEAKFAFSGQCCMEELGSAESVISSDESFHEVTQNDSVSEIPTPLAPSTSMLSVKDLEEAQDPSTAPDDIAPSTPNRDDFDSLTVQYHGLTQQNASALIPHASHTSPRDNTNDTLPISVDELANMSPPTTIIEHERPKMEGQTLGKLIEDQGLPLKSSLNRAHEKEPPLQPEDRPVSNDHISRTSRTSFAPEENTSDKVYQDYVNAAMRLNKSSHDSFEQESRAQINSSTSQPDEILKHSAELQTSSADDSTAVDMSQPHGDGAQAMSRGHLDDKSQAVTAKTIRAGSSPCTTSHRDSLAKNEDITQQAYAGTDSATHRTSSTSDQPQMDLNEPAVPNEMSPTPQPVVPSTKPFDAGNTQPLALRETPTDQLVPVAKPEKQKPVCGRCQKTIVKGQYVRALSETFHIECFTCIVSRL